MTMLFESERRVMDVLWDEGQAKAGHIAKVLELKFGWNRNTTYTLIKKCTEKGFVKRIDPGYVCIPLITKKQVCESETEELLDKYFDGSVVKMFNTMMSVCTISKFELKRLRKAIKKAEEKAEEKEKEG